MATNDDQYLSYLLEKYSAAKNAARQRHKAQITQYDEELGAIQSETAAQKRAAYQNYMMGKRDVPRTMAAQGLGGQGISESSASELIRIYQQALMNAQSERVKRQGEVRRKKQSAESALNAELSELDGKYYGEAANYRKSAKSSSSGYSGSNAAKSSGANKSSGEDVSATKEYKDLVDDLFLSLYFVSETDEDGVALAVGKVRPEENSLQVSLPQFFRYRYSPKHSDVTPAQYRQLLEDFAWIFGTGGVPTFLWKEV